MFPAFTMALLTGLMTAVPPQTAPLPVAETLTLGEVEPLAGGGDARVLAARVLPPDLRDRVVEGRVRRQWLPGQVWWIGFRERASVAGPDLCERMGHSVQAAAREAPGDRAPPGTELTMGAVESWTEIAVLPPGQAASPARCEAAQGYVSRSHQGERRIAAYRVMRAAMAAAGGKAALPFEIRCKAEAAAACVDARAALASLPVDALFDIGISCLDDRRIREGSIIRCPTLTPGQPYHAEIRFGMSGADGQSWRMTFVHTPGWPEAIVLNRSTVVYH